MSPAHASAAQAPRSPAALFWACTWLALQGFGGVLAVVQRELVERRRWLTQEQFVQDWAAAQLLPGPNVVNLCLMIGGRHFGWRGALAALAGMLTAPLVLLLTLAVGFAHIAQHTWAQGALHGMAVVAAGLILGTALRLTAALRGHPLGWGGCALLAGATLAGVAGARWPLVGVLAAAGTLGCGWTAWRLRHRGLQERSR